MPGDEWLPAGQRRELARISLLARDVRRSQQRRIDSGLDRNPAQRDQLVDRVGDTYRAAAAEIVNIARHTGYQRQAIGADHVACVSKVAFDVQVADVENRLAFTQLNLGQLSSQTRDDEPRIVAWSSVTELS